jgi:hypothetical protein
MKILLYNPDNGVTRNFMPHLWMFLLQALTPVVRKNSVWRPSDRDVGTYLFGFAALENPRSQPRLAENSLPD